MGRKDGVTLKTKKTQVKSPGRRKHPSMVSIEDRSQANDVRCFVNKASPSNTSPERKLMAAAKGSAVGGAK